MDGVLYGIPDGFSNRIICPSPTMMFEDDP